MSRRPPWPPPERPDPAAALIEAIAERTAELVARRLAPALADREPAPPSAYLTNREAAELARVSTKTIRAWARSGRLRAYGSARKPLYRRADLCALIEADKGEQEARSGPPSPESPHDEGARG